MGQYIAKMYLESKHRPHYIISETNQEKAKKIFWKQLPETPLRFTGSALHIFVRHPIGTESHPSKYAFWTDMQDPPSLLPEMLSILKSGNYDSVASRRVSRTGEPALRSWLARKFYRIINRISDAEIIDGARDFRWKRQIAHTWIFFGKLLKDRKRPILWTIINKNQLIVACHFI